VAADRILFVSSSFIVPVETTPSGEDLVRSGLKVPAKFAEGSARKYEDGWARVPFQNVLVDLRVKATPGCTSRLNTWGRSDRSYPTGALPSQVLDRYGPDFSCAVRISSRSLCFRRLLVGVEAIVRGQ